MSDLKKLMVDKSVDSHYIVSMTIMHFSGIYLLYNPLTAG